MGYIEENLIAKTNMTNIYVGRNKIGQFTCDGRKYSRWGIIRFTMTKFIKRTLLTMGVLSLTGWAAVGGSNYFPRMVKADTIVVTKTVTQTIPQDFPPILTKICNAESGGKQFKKDGHVVRGLITPSDIGYCQINEIYWNDKARDLGYDIYTEQGNKDMALWLFMNQGDLPWSASRSVWSK